MATSTGSSSASSGASGKGGRQGAVEGAPGKVGHPVLVELVEDIKKVSIGMRAGRRSMWQCKPPATSLEERTCVLPAPCSD